MRYEDTPPDDDGGGGGGSSGGGGFQLQEGEMADGMEAGRREVNFLSSWGIKAYLWSLRRGGWSHG